MKLSTVSTQTSRATVEVDGLGSFWVDFRPQAVTPELIATKAAAEKSGDAGAIAAHLAEMVCSVVAGWDLQEDDGDMVALTPERVSRVPVSVLYLVLNASREAVSVGEAKPATFVGG